MEAFLLPAFVLALMYLLLIRPQKKRMRQREALIRSADVGDEVATVGGLIGTIVAVEDDAGVVCIEVDPSADIELRIQRRAIGEILNRVDDPDEPGESDESGDDSELTAASADRSTDDNAS